MFKKPTFVISFILFIWYTNIYAQLSIGGMPYGYSHKSISEINHIEIPAPDTQILLAEDVQPENAYKPFRAGVILPVNKDFFQEATHQQLAEGDLWQLKLSSEKAFAISLYFNKFYLPKGSKLFIYNTEKTQLIGAFTYLNNDATGLFATESVDKDAVILEYFQPYNIIDNPIMEIAEIGYTYKDLKATGFGASGSCEVNANCSEGDAYRNQQRAAVRIKIKNSFGEAYCTGTLINNTKQDNTPYLLTASHCMEYTDALLLKQWVFYFNYESPGCQNPSTDAGLKTQTLTGADLMARDPSEGDAGGDFCLLKLVNKVPESYNSYFAGWNRSGNATTSGVCFHHPAGDVKKISTYKTKPTASAYVSKITHWKVNWSATTNGYGVTEGGSSGSALFNSNGEIIGNLTGGGSSCSAKTAADYYGMFSYNWTSNGNADSLQLKPWLDPINSNVMSLGGTNVLAIEDLAENNSVNNFTIAPNPAQNEIFITFKNTAPPFFIIHVYNSLGKIILTEKFTNNNLNIRLDTKSLGKGVYFLNISSLNGENLGTEKIIKLGD